MDSCQPEPNLQQQNSIDRNHLAVYAQKMLNKKFSNVLL